MSKHLCVVAITNLMRINMMRGAEHEVPPFYLNKPFTQLHSYIGEVICLYIMSLQYLKEGDYFIFFGYF